MSNNSNDELLRMMREHNEGEEEKAFDNWCKELLSQPGNLELRPEDGFQVDIELQPPRWLSLGVELIESRRVTARVELAGGIQGPEVASRLPYPVFQMGTEIFLKGMWLCQFENCRRFTHSSYIDANTRGEYLKKLGPSGLGHDLIKIINEVRKISEYARHDAALKFLDLVERILRCYYFPPYQAHKRNRWAYARYPKRVYNDVTQQSRAESFKNYPPANWIAKLFREMERDADRIWSLRTSLSEKMKRLRPN